jgi:hypothetical protein
MLKTLPVGPTVILCSLYYPKELAYHRYYHLIQEWNTWIKGLGYPVLRVDELCADDIDFVSSVEPSGVCSHKLLTAILRFAAAK